MVCGAALTLLMCIIVFPLSILVSPGMFPIVVSMYMSTCNDAVPARIFFIRRVDELMCEITVTVSDHRDPGSKHDTLARRPVFLDKMLCSVILNGWMAGTEVTLLHNHVLHDRACKRLASTAEDTQRAIAWHKDRTLVVYFGVAFVVLVFAVAGGLAPARVL
jgi:hypothetical protein